MYSLIKRFFFGHVKLKTVAIVHLADTQIDEQVFLQKDEYSIDVSKQQGIICLEPFSIAVWLSKEQTDLFNLNEVSLKFYKKNKISSSFAASIIEEIETDKSVLLLYKIKHVRNYQLTFIHRFVLFAYLLSNKTSTYGYRKIISALYSYPRKIIIVSYKDEQYYNIFPMDIQGYMENDNMYLLGLRTTNVALDRIIETGKIVVCDTGSVPINIVYALGKHHSTSPPKIEELPFTTINSELFKFPIPDFTESYKEVQIIMHKKMGYHMLLIGEVVNSIVEKHDSSPLCHISFLESLISDYDNIEGQF